MSSQPKGGANGNVLMCIECDDVPAVVFCNECEDGFCGLCHHWLHKKGKRTQPTYYSVHEKDHPVKLTLEGTTEHFIKEFQITTAGTSSHSIHISTFPFAHL